MPALCVSVDGKTVATVSTDGLDSLSVNVSGTLVDETFADLGVAGGSYPERGDSTYLIWVSELALQPGQLVVVSLLEKAETGFPGKTIDELFPDKEPTVPIDFKPTSEVFEELRAKPKLRERFSFRFESSLGTRFVGSTTPEEHGFGFTVHWNSLHPERARVSLHSYSLKSLEARGPMNNHVEERIYHGDSVRFELVV